MKRRLVGLLVMIGLLAAGCTNEAPQSPRPTPATSASLSAIARLKVGDCTGKVDLSGATITELPAIPCDSAHYWEVHAVVPLTGDTYPGATALAKQAEESCVESFVSYVGVKPEYSRYSSAYLTSDENAWQVPENRVVTCLVGSEQNELTGSAKGDSLVFPSKNQCTGRQDVPGKPVKIIDCAQKHYYEVFAEKKVSGKKAPTEAEELKLYRSVCVAGFKKFVGVDISKSKYEISYYLAGKDIWKKIADHRIVCSVGSPKGGIKGSLKGVKK